MQVKVNCKKSRIDYGADYRKTFDDRLSSPKSFTADMSGNGGGIKLVKDDNAQEFSFEPGNVLAISFYLDDTRPKAEIVRANGEAEYSFVVAPTLDNDELEVDGVFAFKEMLDDVSEPAGFEVSEYIDPNSLGLCPDGVENMDELVNLREAELKAVAEARLAADAAAETGDIDVTLEFDAEGAVSPVPDEFEAGMSALDDDIDEEDFEDYVAPAAAAIVPEGAFGGAEGDGAAADDLLDALLSDDDDDIEELSLEELGATVKIGPATELADELEPEPEPEAVVVPDPVSVEQEPPASPAVAAAQEEAVDAAEKLAQMKERIEAERSRLASRVVSQPIVEEAGPLTAELAETVAPKVSNADEAMARLGQLFAAKRNERTLITSNSEPVESNPADNIVAGLIEKIQEQTSEYDDLAAKYRKQQAMARHYQEQLSAVSAEKDAKAKEADDLTRQLRISQENQRKSEQYVADARAETRKLIQESDDKVKSAVAKMSKMRKRVNAAETERDAAIQGEKKALMERAEAVMQAEEAKRALEDEQAHSVELNKAFAAQLDEFTAETLDKLSEEINRSKSAEQSYLSSLQQIEQLEKELKDAKERHADEMQSAQADADIRVADAVAEGKAKLVGMIPESELTDANARIEQLETSLSDAEQEKDDLVEQYKSARMLIDELNNSLSRQEDEFEEFRKAAEDKLASAAVAGGNRDDVKLAQEQTTIMVSSMLGMAREQVDYRNATEQFVDDIASLFEGVGLADDPRGDLVRKCVENYRAAISEIEDAE